MISGIDCLKNVKNSQLRNILNQPIINQSRPIFPVNNETYLIFPYK